MRLAVFPYWLEISLVAFKSPYKVPLAARLPQGLRWDLSSEQLEIASGIVSGSIFYSGCTRGSPHLFWKTRCQDSTVEQLNQHLQVWTPSNGIFSLISQEILLGRKGMRAMDLVQSLTYTGGSWGFPGAVCYLPSDKVFCFLTHCSLSFSSMSFSVSLGML